MTIRLTGIYTPSLPETRDLAIIEVDHNNTTYQWKMYIPQGENIQSYIDAHELRIKSEIDTKELEWTNLNPKTQTMVDPFTGENVQVDITREEIVKPEIPDYYAKRRDAYPAIGDQIDAILKGSSSENFQTLLTVIQEIKNSYPKPI